MQLGSFLRDNAAWLGAGALLTFGSSFGQTFFISVFAGEIRGTFGLSHGEWGSIYAMGTIASAALMLTVGGIADGYRTRTLACLNMILFAAVCAGMALAPAAWMLPFLIFGLRFCGQGMMSHLSIVSVGRWFQASRGRAVSITSMGFSLGEASLPIFFVFLMGVIGWRASWGVAAVMLLVFIPVLFQLLRRERSPRGQAEQDMSTGMGGRHWRRGDALRHWLFWAVFPGFLAQPVFSTSFLFHQVHLADTNAWTLEEFARLFPLYTAVSIAALFTGGWLVDRFGVGRIMPFFLLPMALGFTVIANGDTLLAAAICMICLGMMQGTATAVAGAFWPVYYGTRHLGSIRAVAVSMMVFATGIGPAITGKLIDRGISFDTQMFAMAVFSLIASASFALAIHRARGAFAESGAQALRR